DLISVGNESVIESKIQIITLYFRRNAGGCVANPFSQRSKFFVPKLSESGVSCCETTRPAQIFPIARETLFPLAQFCLRFGNVFSARLVDPLVDLSEIDWLTRR